MSISTEEYRKLLNDYLSTDEQVIKRIGYIEALCRNVTIEELRKVVTQKSSSNTKLA